MSFGFGMAKQVASEAFAPVAQAVKKRVTDPLGHAGNRVVNTLLANAPISTAVTTAVATELGIRATGATPIQSGVHALMAGAGAYASVGATREEAQRNLTRWVGSAVQNTANTVSSVAKEAHWVTTPLGVLAPTLLTNHPAGELLGGVIGGGLGYGIPQAITHKAAQIADGVPQYMANRLRDITVPWRSLNQELTNTEQTLASLVTHQAEVSEGVVKLVKDLPSFNGGEGLTPQNVAQKVLGNGLTADDLNVLHTQRAADLQAKGKAWLEQNLPTVTDLPADADKTAKDAAVSALEATLKTDHPEIDAVYQHLKTEGKLPEATTDDPLAPLKSVIDGYLSHYQTLKATPTDASTPLGTALSDDHVIAPLRQQVTKAVTDIDTLQAQQSTLAEQIPDLKQTLANAEATAKKTIALTNAQAAANFAEGEALRANPDKTWLQKAIDPAYSRLQDLESIAINNPTIAKLFEGNPHIARVKQRDVDFAERLKAIAETSMPTDTLLTPQQMLQNAKANAEALAKVGMTPEVPFYGSPVTPQEIEGLKPVATPQTKISKVLSALEVAPTYQPVTEGPVVGSPLEVVGQKVGNLKQRFLNTFSLQPEPTVIDPTIGPAQAIQEAATVRLQKRIDAVEIPFLSTSLGKYIGDTSNLEPKAINWRRDSIKALQQFNDTMHQLAQGGSTPSADVIDNAVKALIQPTTASYSNPDARTLGALIGLAGGRYGFRSDILFNKNAVGEAQVALDYLHKIGVPNLEAFANPNITIARHATVSP